MKIVGIFCVIGGALWVFFTLNMDTSVSGGLYGGRVNNFGLMADRQLYLTMAIGLLVIGVLPFIFGKPAAGAQGVTTIKDSGMRACPFCAELIKNEAIKCKHCASEVQAVVTEAPQEKALALPRAFFEKPDGMSLGEYYEKFMEHYAVERVSNGYMWRAERYGVMQDLVNAVRASTLTEAANIQESNAPEAIDEMARFGITFNGEKYIFGGYRYDKLSDALNYAKLQGVGASDTEFEKLPKTAPV